MTDDMASAWPPVGESTVTRSNRWRGLSALAFFAITGALFLRHPPLLLVSGFAVVLAAYARIAPAPPAPLTIERSVDDADVAPGEEVDVTVTIHNTSRSFLPHVRVVDGLPSGVRVVDGSPQFGAAVLPGRALSYTYTIEVPGGDYEFQPAYVATRDIVGVVERRTRIEAVADGDVSGEPELSTALDIPLRKQLSRRVGRRASDERGEGLAFETVRDYQKGDPMSRIDWRHKAKTDELRTVEMQKERSASIVLVVDTRPAAAVVPGPEGKTAIERSVESAGAVFDSLYADGHQVGLAALGPDPAWLAPSRGESHRERARLMVTEDNSFSVQDGENGDGPADSSANSDEDDGEGETNVDSADDASTANTTADQTLDASAWLRSQMPSNAQAFVFTPLCDSAIIDSLHTLEASGTDVTVISPDATSSDSPGQNLARIERSIRVRELEARGIPVIDQPAGVDVQQTLLATGQAPTGGASL